MRVLSPAALAVVLLLFSAAGAVRGQSGEYTAPGALGNVPEDAREALQKAVDESRWRLGPVRIDPWISLREIAWVKTLDRDGDLTASAGAGLRAYLPVGSRLTFVAHALPEYIWWRERKEERRLGGRAGLGLFYYANRLAVEVTATSSDLDLFPSQEVDRRAAVDSRELAVKVEVPLARRFDLFARASRGDFAITDRDPSNGDLSNLDRRTTGMEGGVRVRLGSSVTLGFGAGTTETVFDETARDLSNDGDYLLGELGWQRTKLGATLAVRKNDLRGQSGSDFGEFTETTWRAQVHWAPSRKIGLTLYGQSALSYSVNVADAYFVDERVGVVIPVPLGRRLSASAFYETGEYRYDDGLSDDVSSWGGTLTLPIAKRLRFSAVGRLTETTTATDTRRVSELGLRATLSLGSDRSAWY